MIKHYLQYSREILRNPKKLGSIAPSGEALCCAMARETLPFLKIPGVIVELGPGLGHITRRLLDYGVPAERLVLIEHSKNFVRHLQRTYPRLKNMQGDALHFDQLIDQTIPIAAVVSSLPLQLFKNHSRENFIDKVFCYLSPRGAFIQYSYLDQPLPLPSHQNCLLSKSAWIWQNLPPARIWVYHKTELQTLPSPLALVAANQRTPKHTRQASL